jgi:hypothetical protein
MKKIIILLIFLINIAYSLDTTSTKYYPLKVGNSWTYLYQRIWGHPLPDTIIRTSIINSFTANGHLYYLFTDSSKLRIDSTTGNLLDYTTTYGCPWLINEFLQDSLASKYNDSSRAMCSNDLFTHCSDTSNWSVFGVNRKHKKFSESGFESYSYRQYAREIGLIFSQYYYPFCLTTHILRGCVINGVVYGDTTLSKIGKISSEVPLRFSLYQNYPNPFNPVTKIKFDVTVSHFEGGKEDVKLVIFNIQGKEITTLVNQQLQSGTYEVDWNASDYPSGVYFYKLTAGDFIAVKKMVLIK